MMLPRPFREKKIGKAAGRRYDLPLNRGDGEAFLPLLIGLMSFLAVLALAAFFTLSAMSARWSGGLENKMTVEVPAQDTDGKLLTPAQVKERTEKLEGILKNYPAVASAHALNDDEIAALVKPWLGSNLAIDKVPLPGLVSLELKETSPETPDALRRVISDAVPGAQLDTHESWLHDVLRFTGALQFAAALLVLVIGATAATAVAGAVRARMAVHKSDVELLHLMGAMDSYVARQFQRHSMALALQGSVAGTMAGLVALLCIGWISGRMGVNLLPDFHLAAWQMGAVMCLPVIAALLAIITARRTVMHTLERML